MTKKLLLALDFGGTKLSAAMTFPGNKEWLAQSRIFTPGSADCSYEYATMVKMARDLVAEVGNPDAMGVSFGGPVDATSGLVRLSHHVAGWENFPLQAKLEEEFQVPVVIDNDANAATLGEYRFGAGMGCSTVFYVTVSTGIGGGWIINNQLYQGFNGMAGEIGHTVINPGGMACVCGKYGCLEAEACGPGIANRARLAIKNDPVAGAEMLKLLHQTSETITAEHISRASALGNLMAQQILSQSAEMLGRGLANAITLMNPKRVILGGGVIKSGAMWWKIVREFARRNTLPEIPVDVVPAQLGDDAPLWGAVALARTLLEKEMPDLL